MITARNDDLCQAGKEVLVEILGRRGVSASDIEERASLKVDEPERIRLHMGNLILYAYDFRIGRDTKERFESAASSTRKLNKSMHIEQFVAQGYIAKSIAPDVNIIGWYLTQVPKS